VALIIFAVCLAVGVVGAGGYLVLQAANKPANNGLIAVILDTTDSPSMLAEIQHRVVSMPEVAVDSYASPEELPQWFPGRHPWGDLHPEAYLVKLRPGANRDAVRANLRDLPGVYMVTDVHDTGRTIGASGVM
jgi:cell division protein FtsX